MSSAYERIAEQLTDEIESGTWPAGKALPPLKKLAERFQVSVPTVRTAQDQLRQLGLLYSGYVDGVKGMIVRERGRLDITVTNSINGPRKKSNMDVFVELADRLGKTPSKRFSMSIIPMPPLVAARMGTGDELVVLRQVVQRLDGEPWGCEYGYYPYDLARELGFDSRHDIPQGTLRVLQDAGYVETAHVDEATYEAAEGIDAQVLDLPIGYPLEVHLRTAATDERITRVTRHIRIGDRTRLLWRLGSSEGLCIIDAANQNEDGDE